MKSAVRTPSAEARAARTIKEALGVTLREIDQGSGVSPETLRKWLHGYTQRLSDASLADLCAYFTKAGWKCKPEALRAGKTR